MFSWLGDLVYAIGGWLKRAFLALDEWLDAHSGDGSHQLFGSFRESILARLFVFIVVIGLASCALP